jgi:putative transposase
MGRVGAAGDNAAMKSLFPLLQHNVLDPNAGQPHKDLRLAIIT